MQRLRGLSEAECYLRCYGDRVETVSLVELEGPFARCLVDLSEQHLQRAIEERLQNSQPQDAEAA